MAHFQYKHPTLQNKSMFKAHFWFSRPKFPRTLGACGKKSEKRKGSAWMRDHCTDRPTNQSCAVVLQAWELCASKPYDPPLILGLVSICILLAWPPNPPGGHVVYPHQCADEASSSYLPNDRNGDVKESHPNHQHTTYVPTILGSTLKRHTTRNVDKKRMIKDDTVLLHCGLPAGLLQKPCDPDLNKDPVTVRFCRQGLSSVSQRGPFGLVQCTTDLL